MDRRHRRVILDIVAVGGAVMVLAGDFFDFPGHKLMAHIGLAFLMGLILSFVLRR